MDISDWEGLKMQPPVASLSRYRQRDAHYRAMVGGFRKAGYSRLCSHQMANGFLDANDTNRKKTKS